MSLPKLALCNQRFVVIGLVAILLIMLSGCIFTKENHQALSAKPQQLKVNEGFVNPIGFYDATPKFSWQLRAGQGVSAQKGYQIVVASKADLLPNKPDLWDSQKVSSSKTSFIAYQGKPLSSRQQVYWQIRYWNQDGQVSEWSEPAYLELGLLENSDWRGKWIEIDSQQPIKLNQFNTPIHIPQHLRTEFTSNKNIAQARLYITAKGVFEAFINGERVGEDVLTPGYTPYKKRIETLTYDVTDLLKQGRNALGIQLAEGWYSGRFGPKRHWHKKLQLTPKVLAQIEI